MASKTRKILCVLFFSMMSLALRAAGQESTYSADSLIAAFDKGSKVSLKGSQITFHDVVVESEDAKLTFKTSHNNRVICRLVPATASHDKPPSVGSEITVIGKVRGRGLLGNVTLDNCSAAPAADSQPSPNLQQDAATAADGAVSQDAPEAASPPVPSEEAPNDFAPLPIAQPPKPPTRRLQKQAAPSNPPAEQNQTPAASDSPRDIPYRFYTLLILGGAIGYSILSTLLKSAVHAMRSPRYPANADTDEVRKAALKALLLKNTKRNRL